jgi:hypothetical protein
LIHDLGEHRYHGDRPRSGYDHHRYTNKKQLHHLAEFSKPERCNHSDQERWKHEKSGYLRVMSIRIEKELCVRIELGRRCARRDELVETPRIKMQETWS